MIKRILLRFLLVLGIVVAVLVANYFLFALTRSSISEGESIQDRDAEKVALLVIDIQEGTTGTSSGYPLHQAQSELFIKQVNAVIEESYRRDQLIIYIRTEVVNPLINILNSSLARGSLGSELDQRLAIKPGPVVVKRKSDSFSDTDLDRILAEHNIGTLVLVGLDAAHCVKTTVLAARNRGYSIAVVEDAVISESEELKTQALNEFAEMDVDIISSD